MEGQALFDALWNEEKALELLRIYEELAESATSISKKVTYLLNAAHLSDQRLGLRRKALKVRMFASSALSARLHRLQWLVGK